MREKTKKHFFLPFVPSRPINYLEINFADLIYVTYQELKHYYYYYHYYYMKKVYNHYKKHNIYDSLYFNLNVLFINFYYFCYFIIVLCYACIVFYHNNYVSLLYFI